MHTCLIQTYLSNTSFSFDSLTQSFTLIITLNIYLIISVSCVHCVSVVCTQYAHEVGLRKLKFSDFRFRKIFKLCTGILYIFLYRNTRPKCFALTLVIVFLLVSSLEQNFIRPTNQRYW